MSAGIEVCLYSEIPSHEWNRNFGIISVRVAGTDVYDHCVTVEKFAVAGTCT